MKKNENRKEPKRQESWGFNYEEFEKEAIRGLKSGKDLMGKEGVLTGLIQRIVNVALEGELDDHLRMEKEGGRKNRRNGHTHKKLDTSVGPVSIQPPRDRESSFEPQLVGKWNRQLGTGVDHQILHLYAGGNSVLDIQHQLQKIYGLDYSTGAISMITDRVLDEVVAWQQRPLQAMYVAVFLDAIHYKVREEGKVQTKAIYTVFGVDVEGGRDVLGLYIGDHEGAQGWGRILEDIHRRGVEDVLFFCVDGLKGFKEAIQQVYPKSFVQRCIVHMIRTSVRFVSERDLKAVCRDLRTVYGAADEEQALIALEAFERTWGGKYKEIAPAWRANWSELMLYMSFGANTRRMIYTTNAVEALHRLMRKATKTKGAWINSRGLIKQLYLTLMYHTKGWKKMVFGWVSIQRELIEYFGDRYSNHLP